MRSSEAAGEPKKNPGPRARRDSGRLAPERMPYGFDASFISGLPGCGLGFGLRGDVSAAAFAEPSADTWPDCLPAVLLVVEFTAFCFDAVSGSALFMSFCLAALAEPSAEAPPWPLAVPAVALFTMSCFALVSASGAVPVCAAAAAANVPAA